MVRLANSMNRGLGLHWVVAFALLAGSAVAAGATEASPPGFSKAFSPSTIGPGSTSMLIFTIDNSESVYPIDLLAFDDEFPFGMSLAAVPFSSNTCGGTLEFDDDDADSAYDVRLTGGMLGADQTCEIVVNVVGTTDCGGLAPQPNSIAIECANTSGPLTSDAGSSGTAAASLFVSVDEPGFSKSFSPATVPIGGRSTLTFLIDNTANPGAEATLSFIDTLPDGMVVASPALASTTCGSPPTVEPTLTATPGSSTISFSYLGSASFPVVGAGSTCTISVDVIGSTVGTLGNVSGNIATTSEDFAGKATAALEVTGVEDLLELSKEFIDDPVPPGFSTTLELSVTNKSRDDSATGITFSDDLDDALSGLAPASPLPAAPCGAGSMLTFAGGILTLTGGSLAPEATCTISVVLDVPLGSVPGSYLNTAGPVGGDVGGSPETGNSASDLLFVVDTPVLFKEFTDDPVGAGGTVMLEFTIINTNSGSPLTEIGFTDDLNTAIPCDEGTCPEPALAANVLIDMGMPDPIIDPCGPGSELTVFDPPDFPPFLIFPPDPSILVFTGGSLAEAGMPGDTCTFSVPIDVRDDLPSGTYTNTSEDVTGEYAGMVETTGPPAVGDVIIVGAPRLTKEFTDDPAIPGGTVTLVFTIENIDGSDTATAIAFSDDLGASLAGLTVTTVDGDTCGGTPGGVGTDMFSYTGGTLLVGETCVITLTLTLPGAPAGGVFTNTTSAITATVGGIAVSGSPGEDDLSVSAFNISKEFTDDPVIAGDTVTLEFTLDNTAGATLAEDIEFDDPIDPQVVPGLTVVAPPLPTTVCGGTLATADLGAGNDEAITFTGGEVLAGTDCSFSVTLMVPPGTPDGTEGNSTISNFATIGGVTFVSLNPAFDELEVNSTLLELTKEFTDDPVTPDSPVTLVFTLENLSSTDTVTDIEFEDDLDAALSGLSASGATFNDCGGMAAGFPTGLFEYSGGTLGPGATCTIVLTVDVPPAPLPGSVFPNTTSFVTGKVGLLDVFGAPASDDLIVQTVTLEKSFDGPTTATGTAVLTFTIENLDSVTPLTDLAFFDDLETVISGLVATALPADGFCGTDSTAGGPSFLTFTRLDLDPAGTCTFDVTVEVPVSATAGSFLNTTSPLSDEGLAVAEPATAFLDIEPAPAFSKSFDPDSIFVTTTSLLTFTIDNSASAFAATDLDFTDVLPAGVVVDDSPAPSKTCTGGMVTAVPGSGTISYSGGSVAAGATCVVTVAVTSDTAAVYVNTSGDLTSSSGNSGTATDTLTVLAAGDTDLEITKEATTDPVLTGGTEVYRITVSNISAAPAVDVTLEDTLPAGTTFLYANPPEPDCVEAGGVVTCELGAIAAGDSVEVLLAVRLEVPTTLSIENSATVSSSNTDVDPGNNFVMTSTAVLSRNIVDGIADSNGNGSSDTVSVARNPLARRRDGDDGSPLVRYRSMSPAYSALAARLVPNIGGAADDDLVVVGYRESDTRTRVEVSDPLTEAQLRVISHGGPWMPIDFAVASSFGGTTDPEVVLLQERLSDRRGRILVKDLGSGIVQCVLLYAPDFRVMAVEVLPDANGNMVDEVGVLLFRPSDGTVRWQVNDLLTKAVLNTSDIATGAFPAASTLVDDATGGGVQGLSVLLWRFDIDRLETSTEDAATGAGRVVTVVGAGQVPIDLEAVPNFGGGLADELAAYTFLPSGRGAVRIRDAVSGALVAPQIVLPVAYFPTDLVVIPDYGVTAADEMGLVGERAADGLLRMFVRDAATGGNPSSRNALPVP